VFDDIEPDDHEFGRDHSDREVLARIWGRMEVGDLAVDEGWAILFERYPDEPRFLLLNMYTELSAAQVVGAWSPGYFLQKFEALIERAGGKYEQLLGDLLAVATKRLGRLSAPDAARLQRLHGRVTGGVSEPVAARERLDRLVEQVLAALEERTEGNRPIGAAGQRKVPTDWKSAVAAASGPRRPYSATTPLVVGDVVEHVKFGVGVVTATEPRRAVVLFADATRKLVCG
jgi:hypothetical protein